MEGTAVQKARTATKKRSQLSMIWHQLLKNKLAICGLIIIGSMILASILIGFVVDYDTIIVHDIANRYQAPSAAHWFGTDGFGRDLFLRLVYGARISLFIGIVSVLGGMVAGGAIGSISGFYGGKIDMIVMRFMDVLMAIPYVFLLLHGWNTDFPSCFFHFSAGPGIRPISHSPLFLLYLSAAEYTADNV